MSYRIFRILTSIIEQLLLYSFRRSETKSKPVIDESCNIKCVTQTITSFSSEYCDVLG